MGYFDDEANVDEYTAMAEGYDGRELVEVLRKHLPAGSTVLELGMGSGKDLGLLSEHYQVSGTDSSQVFVERYGSEHPNADVSQLDAITIDTDRHYDAIYSNKVLIHLTPAQLAESFRRQASVLNNGGVVLHSFWHGEVEEQHGGLLFVYHTGESLIDAIGDHFQVLECVAYTEMEENDSLFLVARLRD